MTKPRVLIVDDDDAMCETLRIGLSKEGYEVETRSTGQDALERLREQDFDLLLTDLKLEGMTGLELCQRAVEWRPGLPVIVMTAFGNMKAAIAALRVGAHDFINKPIELETLAHVTRRAIQHGHLREEVKRLRRASGRGHGIGRLLGESAAMKRLYDVVARVSDTDASILLTGESGTGKELVARALHSESSRRDAPFVAINCAAVPAALLESELFGHVKGAFTDARSDRVGLFAEAAGGTILLDEVGEMAPEMQVKLLRVLQERKVRPIGGNTEIEIHTRVVSATNRDLEAEVERGGFREDLYYRLNVVQIEVPPLRARGNDILIIAQHYVERVAERLEKPVKGISSDAARKLLDYDWPGNVRQLENTVERAVTLTRFDQITVEDLPEKIAAHESSRIAVVDEDPEVLLSLDEVERRYIKRVLKAVDNNKAHAARVLGLDRRTLYRKLERHSKAKEERKPARDEPS